jgi:hypothetical protein
VGGQGAWAIWDEKMSPELLEAGVKPYVCSLDGKNPLTFKFLTQGYGWLAKCEKAGLDMEGDPDSVHVAPARSGRGGSMYIKHDLTGDGPVIREVPSWPLND